MNVAHFAVWGVNRCGLYHTAKELILAERLAGIDARFIAYEEKDVQKDGSFTSEKIDWSYKADLLVRHSAIPARVHTAGIPIVLVLHGRPESSVRLQQKKIMSVMNSIANKAHDGRYKAFVTLWPEYVDIWSRVVTKEKLFYVPATIDLSEYKPDNEKFDLGEYNSSPNILISDIWREDVTPFNVLFAAAGFAKKYGGRIHIAGLPKDYMVSTSPFLMSLRQEGLLGHLFGQITHIKGMYTACDIMVTPHVIATRSIRESLASGTPVVAGSGCKYTDYTANPMDIDSFAEAIENCWLNRDSIDARKTAENSFSLEKSGKAMAEVFGKVLTKKAGKRKVFIDIGGHLGETVRRFYREMPDADEYEIYSFEPDLTTFKLLDANVGHTRNVDLINACAGIKDGMTDFFVGRDNNNEGGTTLKGKVTGRVDYKRPSKVESVNFARWLKANVNEGDYVVLKMNIEGGEYELMELLLDNGLTGMINKCFIQLHSHKFLHGEQRQKFHRIEARFYNEAKCKKYLTNKGFYPFNVQ